MSAHDREKYIYWMKIQRKREEMMSLGKKYGLASKHTVKCSQELDRLLNEYYYQFQDSRSPLARRIRKGSSFVALYRGKLVTTAFLPAKYGREKKLV